MSFSLHHRIFRYRRTLLVPLYPCAKSFYTHGSEQVFTIFQNYMAITRHPHRPFHHLHRLNHRTRTDHLIHWDLSTRQIVTMSACMGHMAELSSVSSFSSTSITLQKGLWLALKKRQNGKRRWNKDKRVWSKLDRCHRSCFRRMEICNSIFWHVMWLKNLSAYLDQSGYAWILAGSLTGYLGLPVSRLDKDSALC